MIAKEWIYWDNAPHRYHSFITLDYIFVFLSFRFSQLLPREFWKDSRGAIWICSGFAGILGIWGLFKYFKFGKSLKLNWLVITLIILSLLLLVYFIFMSIYWLCIEKEDKDDEERKRLKQDGIYSDEYRRYEHSTKNNRILDTPPKTDEYI
mmetsp:Transcript_14988/g.13157  ORF Transcript_14988/g.13157 Transcript_14988/m.13157 type:complete len:151 (+) Transcript_14988:100-552(+)